MSTNDPRLPLDDLVARLRADAAMNLELPEVSHLQHSGALELEAADEIQRLLAERDRYYNERNECRALLSHVDSNAYAEALAKACVAELIGWGDDERAELETFCAIALEVMKQTTPSKLREAALRVELRALMREEK